MSSQRSQNKLTLTTAVSSLLAARKLLRPKTANLHGQVVLITGSSRGLGLALAEEFALHGARLVLCGREEQELEQARQHLAEQGAIVQAIPCDMTQREQVQRLVEQATAHYGRIDILVNNAGIITVGPIMAQTLKDYEDSMNVIFWGPLYATMAVLPQMLERKHGCIVNISSIGGKVSVPHLSPYSSAKFALTGFSEGLYAELAREGIKVVTVNPGLMRTGSPPNAIFKGQHHAEYSWFSVADSLPLLSMSAKKAAQQIVRATEKGQVEVTLGFPAKLLAFLHGLLPTTSIKILALTNRFLPRPGTVEGLDRSTGKESQTPVSQSFLTTLGKQAAETYNQHPGEQNRAV